MKYHCVIDRTNGKIIGFHDKKSVANRYKERLTQEVKRDDFYVEKKKESQLANLPDYLDLYLIRYGNNYVQSKYYEYIKDDLSTLLNEYKFAIDVLMKIFEYEKISNKKKKILKDAIMIIEDRIDENVDVFLTPDQLERMKSQYDSFRYQIYDAGYKDEDWDPF